MVSYLRFDFILGEVNQSQSSGVFFNRPLLGGVLGLGLSLRSFRWMQSLGTVSVNNSQVSNEEHYQTSKCCKSSPQYL